MHMDRIDTVVLLPLIDEPKERWAYVKISPTQVRLLMGAVFQTRRPDLTLRVWLAATTHMDWNTGEIDADRKKLAEDAYTNSAEVSRAMSELTKIGAIIKRRRGQKVTYFVNGSIAWHGSEGSRQAAAKSASHPRLVTLNGEKVE